jgi:YbbR domain-containing protein
MKMKKLVFENLGLKMSAVLLATCLWLFVTSRGQSEISLEVPLEFQNVPAGLGIVNDNAKTVIVTVKGQERLMRNLKASDIRVFVDLSKAKRGEGVYPIDRDNIRLPFAMTVTNISPPTCRVWLDEVVSKKIPVRPAVTGSLGKGYYVKAVRVDPPQIMIKGLRSEVKKVSELNTELFDITGLTTTTTRQLNVETSWVNVKTDTSAVKVTVVIAGRKK